MTQATHPLDATVEMIDQAIAGSASMIHRARRSLRDAGRMNDEMARRFAEQAAEFIERAERNAYSSRQGRLGFVVPNLKAARVAIRLALQEEEGR
ncbi:MAG: hypothetical protein LC798_13700 [Chloroflexi bacterium]|nr:hypothetical protein [Chloroflexota bacterium]